MVYKKVCLSSWWPLKALSLSHTVDTAFVFVEISFPPKKHPWHSVSVWVCCVPQPADPAHNSKQDSINTYTCYQCFWVVMAITEAFFLPSSQQSSAAGPSNVASPQPMKESRENFSMTGQILDHIKPCWYWDKKDLAHTPSQSEGLDSATEARYRREGARFIFDVGTRLGLYPWLIYWSIGILCSSS